MSFYVRVFSQAEDFPSLYTICDELLEEGFEFATSPGKDEPEFKESDWRNVVFQYDENTKPIELDRDTKEHEGSIFKEEQNEFLEAVKNLPYSKGQKKALEILKYAVQIYAFEVDEDITEEGWDFLECILDLLCDATDGYVQVDEEGIYGKDGELLVEME
ncbi:MAG TPA: hypothetical protein VD757_00715 [Candidatus Nitrosocosmicus sp.]|nr:hypothetical protein [Candidatus Nitrosocosmicus sp.]